MENQIEYLFFLQKIKTFFDEQSAIANAIGIFTPIIAIGISIYKWIFHEFRDQHQACRIGQSIDSEMNALDLHALFFQCSRLRL